MIQTYESGVNSTPIDVALVAKNAPEGSVVLASTNAQGVQVAVMVLENLDAEHATHPGWYLTRLTVSWHERRNGHATSLALASLATLADMDVATLYMQRTVFYDFQQPEFDGATPIGVVDLPKTPTASTLWQIPIEN